MAEKQSNTRSAQKAEALQFIDALSLDFENLVGVMGVCRIAAAAQANGDPGGYSLRDADLPDALDGARRMLESLRDRVMQLGDYAKDCAAGVVPDKINRRT